MKKWLFVIDVEKCENCHNCFLACKDEHVDNDWSGVAAPQPGGEGPAWIRVEGKERGCYPLIDVAYRPSPCMHCDEAPCLKAARDGAVVKRPDGIVLIDPVKARGQRQLLAACPYGAILWNEALDLPQKCTLCAHLLDSGWTKTRCVQACPTGALSLRSVEEGDVTGLVAVEGLETYGPGHKTAPRVYYKNLHRFTRCFIGGTVAARSPKAPEEKEECAAGAQVTLLDAAGTVLGTCSADAFGDFKFENLEKESGSYTLKIVYGERAPLTVPVDLKEESLNAGVLYI